MEQVKKMNENKITIRLEGYDNEETLHTMKIVDIDPKNVPIEWFAKKLMEVYDRL